MPNFRYLWIYIVFFITIISITVANYLLVQYKIADSVAYANTTNFAARQNKLAQSLVKDAYLMHLRNTHQNHKWQVEKDLAEWNSIHSALQQGSVRYGLDEKLNADIQTDLKQLNKTQGYLALNIANIVSNPADTAAIAAIQQLEPLYARKMAEITLNIQQYEKVDLLSIKREQKQLATISALVLLLEMFLLVIPYHRKLLAAYKELKVRKRQIQINKKIAEDLNDALSLMTAGINAGVWDWNITTGKERWSARLFKLLGYTRDAVTPSFYYLLNNLVHPEDRDRISIAVERHFKEQVPYEEEIRIMMASGQYKWFEISGQAMWNKHKVPIRMSGSIIDIDDIVSYRKRLEYSDFMLEEVGKMAKVGAWEYDLVNNQVRWTKGMYDINELTNDDSVKLKHMLDVYAVKHQLLISSVIKHTSQKHEAYDEELKVTTAKGNERWVRVIGKPMFDEKNNVVTVRGVFQDIHNKKLKELELEHTRQELSMSNKTKDKLLSIIAHDLRSPINNMKSLLDLQSEGIISQQEFFEYVDQIKANLDSLSGAMDNMLHWAFSQFNGFSLNISPSPVSLAVSMAVNLYSNLTEHKNITLSISTSDDHVAMADPDHIFLITRNLLNNAIKFTPEGGHIYLSTALKDSTVSISIRDTGFGMPQQVIDQLKGRSLVSSTNGTSGERGNGIGLNLCFEIAAKNGGSMDIESTPGKGSTFTLKLPYAKNAVAVAQD